MSKTCNNHTCGLSSTNMHWFLKPLLLFPMKTLFSHLPKQRVFHSHSYWLNLQPWSAALTIKFRSHFISINKVKEALRGKIPPVFLRPWRRAADMKRGEERRGILNNKEHQCLKSSEIRLDQSPHQQLRSPLGFGGENSAWDEVRSRIHT